MKTKICNGVCGLEKPLSDFPKRKDNKVDGYRNQCRECCNKKFKEWRKDNKVNEIEYYTSNKKENILKGYKLCNNPKCDQPIKPLSKFHNRNGTKSGKKSRCKDCINKYPKENLSEGYKRCIGGKAHCNELKILSEFSKNRNQCKNCINIQAKQYRKDNKYKIKEYVKKHEKEIKLNKKEWNHKNRKRLNERKKNRYKHDVIFKLKHSMGTMIRRTLKLIGTKKEKKTIEYLGYSSDRLKERLEVNFTEGMNWENYGEWEIDHKIPIDYFIKRGIIDPKIINILSNLQPLWKVSKIINGTFYFGNLNKGNRIKDYETVEEVK